MSKLRLAIIASAFIASALPVVSFAADQSIVEVTPVPAATESPYEIPTTVDLESTPTPTAEALPVTGGASLMLFSLLAVTGVSGALYFLLPSRND